MGIAAFSAKLLPGATAMLNRRSYSSAAMSGRTAPVAASYETALRAYVSAAAQD
jgi:hypothetical protein